MRGIKRNAVLRLGVLGMTEAKAKARNSKEGSEVRKVKVKTDRRAQGVRVYAHAPLA